jgi:hypothetical protein
MTINAMLQVKLLANVNHLLILSNPLYALTMARAFRWLSCVAALKGLRSSSPQR